jgi:hypothetical protein
MLKEERPKKVFVDGDAGRHHSTDLEGREQQAKRSKFDIADAQRMLDMEVQRIRDENSRKIFVCSMGVDSVTV